MEAWTVIAWFSNVEMGRVRDHYYSPSIAYKISGVGGNALGRSKPFPPIGILLDSADEVVQGRVVLQKVALID